MARKRLTAEKIVAKLRRVDVLMAQGRQVADAVRAIGVTEVTYYRWRNEYGGLKGDQVKRLKELEIDNNGLRRAVSELTLDKLILAEAAKGTFFLGRMMQAPFLNIPDVRERIGRSHLSRAVEVRRTSFLGLTRSHRPRGTPPPAWKKLSRQTRAELYAAIGACTGMQALDASIVQTIVPERIPQR